MAPDAHKSWSLWAAAALAAFDAFHVTLPVMQAYLAPQVFAGINLAAAVAIAFLRVLKQPGLGGGDSSEQTPPADPPKEPPQ